MGDSEIKPLELKDISRSLPSPPPISHQGSIWIKEVPTQIETETQTSPQHYCASKCPDLQAVSIVTKQEKRNGDYKVEISKDYCKNYEIQPLVQKKTDFDLPRSASKKNLSTSKENLTENDVLLEVESVISAYTALFFSCFNFLWSIAVAYWHLLDGRVHEGIFTVMITFFGGVIVEIVYLGNKHIQLKRIWKESKIAYMLNLIPCLTSIVMSAANTVFALKESRSKTYSRPWYKSRVIFLTEALALSFLQCIFQACILMEDGNSIPSFKGFFIYFGIVISTFGIAFARIRYDMSLKFERFGKAVEKYMRFAMIWSYKVLWILTICCSLIVIRINFPNHLATASIVGFIGLQLFFELQILLSTTSMLRRFYVTSVGLFFIVPQFSWLVALITWVNFQPNIYETYIGNMILGSYFYAEFICLAGWLSDSCRDKETCFISFYPHFFGNILSSVYKQIDSLVLVA